MNSLSGSSRKILFLAVCTLGCLLWILPGRFALAQDAQQYTPEEYSAYQAVTGEADPAKKTDLILKFYKAYPKSTLAQHVSADFQNMLKGLQDAKKWAQIISLGRQFLTVSPDDAYTIALVAGAYSETKDYKQFVVFGEEAYKTNPNPNLAYAIAKAYQNIGNNAKLAEWAEKTVAKLPDNYEMLLELTKIYAEANRIPEAEKYARQCLKVIQAAPKPEQSSEKDWATYKTYAQGAAYYILGKLAFDKQDYTNSISNLENSLKFNQRNDYAYYFLGQSYWQARRTDMALKNFAKAMILNGAVAPQAKQHLENLWKQTHAGSLVGLDKVTAVAKTEMGIK